MLVEFMQDGKTPCYLLRTNLLVAENVHGAYYDRTRGAWLYPAYAPFEERVFHDIGVAFKGITWSPEALAQHQRSEAAEAARKKNELPAGFTFKTPPFDHQVEGTSFLYHRLRAGLLWAMGTGKSKVVVDYKRLLPNERLLIVSPKVTLYNWKREFERHAGGEISVGVIAGDLEEKREMIRDHKKYDVLVTSYGSARNLGFPVLHKDTLEYLQHIRHADDQKRPMSTAAFEALCGIARKMASAEDQLSLVKRWEDGETSAGLKRVAEKLRELTPQYLCDMDYQIVVADESHNMQSPSSDQTKAVKALGKKAYRRVILSGSVTLGDPCHVFGQMQFLSTALMPEDLMKFQDTFLTKNPYNKHQVLGYKNLHLLNDRIERIATRKTREECITLPERQIFDVTFQLTGKQRDLYNKLVQDGGADLAAMFEDGTVSLEAANKAVLLNKLGQVCSGFILEPIETDVCTGCRKLAHCVAESIKPYTSKCTEAKGSAPTKEVLLGVNPKMDLLEELLDGVLAEPSTKAIIWAQHTAELNHLEEMLERKKIGHVRVDGRTGNAIQRNIDAFNTDPECRVYVSQVATGIGITLNAATYTFYYSMDWSLGTYLQSNDRNYRVGQANKVTVYRLFGAGTVEEVKAEVLQVKEQVRKTITSKLVCSACPRQEQCATNAVELFEPGCMHQRSVKRTVAKAKELS